MQANGRSVCGQYCLMYCYSKCYGYSFQDYLNLFDDDVVLNDIMASYFYELTMWLYVVYKHIENMCK